MILHDNMNQNDPVELSGDQILTATPYGSGSVLHMANGQIIAVYESPTEVQRLKREEKEQAT